MHNINIWYTCISKQPEQLYTKVFYDSMQEKNFEMNIVYVGKTQWQNWRKNVYAELSRFKNELQAKRKEKCSRKYKVEH